MSNFKIGEKVVCIDDSPGNFGETGLIKNEIYVIQGFNPFDNGFIFNEVKSLGGNGAWKQSRFRKLDYQFAENLLKEISESVNQKHLQN